MKQSRVVVVAILSLAFASTALARGGGFHSSSPPSVARSVPSTRSFSTGESAPKVRSFSAGEAPAIKPDTSTTFNRGASRLLAQAQSARAYSAANPPPKVDYNTPLGVHPTDYSTRGARQAVIFRGYYDRPVPPVYYTYHEPFNPYFWLWLMEAGRSRDDQALWIYNHQHEIDAEHMADLKAKDADLERRLAALEQQGQPIDPKYELPGIGSDLAYKDEVVVPQQEGWAETSPQFVMPPPIQAPFERAAPPEPSSQSGHYVFLVVLGLIIVCGGIFLVWLA